MAGITLKEYAVKNGLDISAARVVMEFAGMDAGGKRPVDEEFMLAENDAGNLDGYASALNGELSEDDAPKVPLDFIAKALGIAFADLSKVVMADNAGIQIIKTTVDKRQCFAVSMAQLNKVVRLIRDAGIAGVLKREDPAPKPGTGPDGGSGEKPGEKPGEEPGTGQDGDPVKESEESRSGSGEGPAPEPAAAPEAPKVSKSAKQASAQVLKLLQAAAPENIIERYNVRKLMFDRKVLTKNDLAFMSDSEVADMFRENFVVLPHAGSMIGLVVIPIEEFAKMDGSKISVVMKEQPMGCAKEAPKA